MPSFVHPHPPFLCSSELQCSTDHHSHFPSWVFIVSLQRCNLVASLSPALLQIPSRCMDGSKEKIRELFQKVELSVSSYDTAWVAMVPSPHSAEVPCFPECVNWLLHNQFDDGSWGLPCHYALLMKDVLSSTLASVLALKKWTAGEEQIRKGLHFIESNFALANDENRHSPVGFDITFPGLIEYAKVLGLKLHIEPGILDILLRKRDMELNRCYGSHSEESKAYLAYVSEGMMKYQDWKMVMKYQRKNGSLFNSPSTTAAALIELQNPGCLDYLQLVLKKFGNAVPTVYPSDMYLRLCMVDNLEKLGVSRHFKEEIEKVLDETYRCWLQSDEEIFLDASTCAIAFRILRKNGYDVSSDSLSSFLEKKFLFSSFGGHLKDTDATLQLYLASELIMHSDESVLGKHLRTGNFLKEMSSSCSYQSNEFSRHIKDEVDYILKFPSHANLERMATRRNIENYNVNSTRILKTSYRPSNVNSEEFLKLAVEDFNLCQSLHRSEFKQLERWVKENRLDQLEFARQKSAYCYFSAATTLPFAELSDARMSWAKNGVLTTVIDDFFDIGGSPEELKNLIQLLEKWNVDVSTDCCSDKVRILFSALHSTICDIGDKAFMWQSRDVRSHVTEIWLNLLNSMLKEAEWTKDMSVPTTEEYMSNGYVSFALGPIILPALYFVGPKLSQEVVQHPEYHHLFKLVSTCGRLLNDTRSFERESKDGKLNAVTLRMIHGNGSISKEEAIAQMNSLIDSKRRELLRLVLKGKEGSTVPRACKDLFWNMSQVLHLFYNKDDGFTSEEMVATAKAILQEPIVVNKL